MRLAGARPGPGEHRLELVVTLAGALFLAVYSACLLFEPAQFLAYNLGYQVPAMVGACLAIIPVRRSRGRERAGWVLLAVMLVTWNLADWVYAGHTVFLDRPPAFPGLPDIFYFAGYFAFFPAAALLLFPGRRVVRGAWLLDALIVMAAASAISWVYLIEPAAAANDGLIDKMAALAYPALDLGILAIVVTALYQGGGANRWRAGILGIATLLMVGADSAYTYSWAVVEMDADGGFLDLLWLASYWTFAVAMVMPGLRPGVEAPFREAWGAVSFLLPYAAALPLIVVALVRAAAGDQSFVLTLGAIGVMGLVALRQLVVLGENRALLARLRRDKEDRDALLRAQSDLGEALFIIDGARITFANDAAAQLLGLSRDELLAAGSLPGVLPASEWGRLAGRFSELVQRGSGSLALALVRLDGRRIELEIATARMDSGAPARFTVVAREITARREAERALHQARRLESLGLLAGGIAHDFNNILTAILVTTSILKRSNGHCEEDVAALALIEDAAMRGAGITGRLLAFSRGGLAEFGPVDLAAVVSSTLRLAAPGLTPSVTVKEDLTAASVYVNGDRGQLEQALLNIIINGRDAMPGGGVLTVGLALEGPSARIRVRDTGIGMSAETRAHIFEPFFTTKGPSGGTGLGLSTAYGIVQGHRGQLSVESEPGAGSTFTITLPAAESPLPVAPEP